MERHKFIGSDRHGLFIALLLIAVALGASMLASCSLSSDQFNPLSSQPAGPLPSPTIQTLPTVTPTLQAVIVTAKPIGFASPLVWWTPEDHAPQPFANSPAARLLEKQVQAYTRLPNGQEVQVILKRPFGKGGILDFLRTASVAAPSVLPDLVTIHSDELAIAARAGILQPLNSLIPSELQSELFTFARQAGQVDGVLYGLLWDADIEHVAYDTRIITSPPKTWDQLLASQATFAIPGAGVEGRVNDSFLIQYIGAGGHIEQGASASIDDVALRRVLDFLATGRKSGRIPDLVLSLPDLAACWAALTAGDVQMAQVRASQYLNARAQADWVGYAATPTWDGRLATIGQGWMLAIVTREPARQAQAAGLIAWLLHPERAGEWTRASGRLPTRPAALAQWDDQDPYVLFVRQQLEIALPRPHNEQFAAISRALQWAERQVLSGSASPEQAVTDVLAEITP